MIIGIDWDLLEPDPTLCCKRIGPTGADLTEHEDDYDGPVNAGYPFDFFGVWGAMHRVNLSDTGVVNAEWGADCYTDTDVAIKGQCMVEIPEVLCWVDTSVANHLRYYVGSISDAETEITIGSGGTHPLTAPSGSTLNDLHPAFMRDGVIRSHAYVGAYRAYKNGTKLESRAGVAPTLNLNISDFRTAAQARTGVKNEWELMDFHTLCLIQLLYIVEYANPNCQMQDFGTHPTVDPYLSLGFGSCGSGSTLLNTGTTRGYGSVSHGVPYVAYNYLDTSYRGIEGLWGQSYTIIDGVYLSTTYHLFVIDHDFDFTGDSYADTTLVVPANVNGRGKTPTVASATAYPYSFIPAAVDASAYGWTWCCDELITGDGSANCELRTFGWYADTDYANGIFSLAANWPYDSAWTKSGARLVYIGAPS